VFDFFFFHGFTPVQAFLSNYNRAQRRHQCRKLHAEITDPLSQHLTTWMKKQPCCSSSED